MKAQNNNSVQDQDGNTVTSGAAADASITMGVDVGSTVAGPGASSRSNGPGPDRLAVSPARGNKAP